MTSTKVNDGSTDYFILLTDNCAQKKHNLSAKSNTEKIPVPRGSLWFSDFEKSSVRRSVTLKSIENTDLFLICDANQVCCIAYIELQLLLAIGSCKERYSVYQREYNKLKTAVTVYEQFSKGALRKITLKLNIKNGNSFIPGNLVWVGCVDGRPGIWFKIDCSNHKGKSSELLVSLGQINKFIDNSDEVSLVGVNKESLDTRCTNPQQLLQEGDRVVWISDRDVPEKGVVRWCGVLDIHSDQFTYGVEFDNPVGSGTGQYRGKQLFQAALKHASFIPAIGLIKADMFETCSLEMKPGNDKSLYSEYSSYNFKSSRSMELASERPSPTNTALLDDRINFDQRQSKHVAGNKADAGESGSHRWKSCDAGKSKPSAVDAGALGYSRAFGSGNSLCKKDISTRSTVQSSSGIGIGSMVQVDIPGLTESQCGVIRWMGRIYNEEIVGIELEEPCSAATDGRFGNQQMFICGHKRGYFAKLSKIKHDDRFNDLCATQSFGNKRCPEVSEPQSCLLANNEYELLELLKRNADEKAGRTSKPNVVAKEWLPDIGRNLGIQGHHNSCYMDATLFSMFAFNHCFDSMLNRKKDSKDVLLYNEIQSVLSKEIVYPLRSNIFVRADKILKLRQLINVASTVQGFVTEEKDPEELLRCFFIETLKTEPFIKFSSGSTEYSFQLLDDSAETRSPTTQHLLQSSLLKLNLRFLESPDCLILQLPRSGRKKVFHSILPSQFLKIKDVTIAGVCYICGKRSSHQCVECLQEFKHVSGVVNFCQACLKTFHSIADRRHHKPDLIGANAGYDRLSQDGDGVLELFAVICIKTSHYVCFTKCGFLPNSPWVFFDSMADRIGLDKGYNIPQITPCLHIVKYFLDPHEYVSPRTAKMEKMPEEVARFICDGYICMYRNLNLLNYR